MKPVGALTLLAIQFLNKENEERRHCRIGKVTTKEGLLSRSIPVPKATFGRGQGINFDRKLRIGEKAKTLRDTWDEGLVFLADGTRFL